MMNEANRVWWPFEAMPLERQTAESKAKIHFFEEAARHGLRAFVEQSNCGVIASDGRECYIVWRGKQRSELFLIEAGEVTAKKMFVDAKDAEALRQAFAEGLNWLLCPAGKS